MKELSLLMVFLASISPALAQEAQWRGPGRSGIFLETGLLNKWPEGGPELILKVDALGNGYSTPVLHEGVIYITGKKGEHDILSAVNLDGEILYQVVYGKSWNATYPETRSTPTVDGESIYLISGMGEVTCLERRTGVIRWSVNAHERYQGEIHRWGVAESPLVVDNMVIYTNGGSLSSVIALDKTNGREVWASESVGGARTYVSPVLYQHGGISLIIASTSDYVVGINPGDGKVWWKYKYLPVTEVDSRGATNSTNSAIIRNNEIFISKGYDQYGVMLEVSADGKNVREKWRTNVLDTHHGHYVNYSDYIFGSNWVNNGKGNWVCLRWDTGEVMYETEWITKGSIALAEGLLYCHEERSGHIALVRPNPEKFDIVSSFQVTGGTGPHWAHPYITDGKLIMRHGEVLMVFNIQASS